MKKDDSEDELAWIDPNFDRVFDNKANSVRIGPAGLRDAVHFPGKWSMVEKRDFFSKSVAYIARAFRNEDTVRKIIALCLELVPGPD